MSTNFFDLVIRLKRAGVDFVVIGGYAARTYGCTIITEDLDICCNFSVDNLMKLQNAIADIHPVHRMTPLQKPLALNESNCSDYKNLYLDTDSGQLDCISSVQGIGDFEEVKRQSNPIRFEPFEVYVLKIDAIIQSKKTLNRQHDLEAVYQLEAIRKMQKKLPNINKEECKGNQ